MANKGFEQVRTSASDAAVKLALVQELAYFVKRGLERLEATGPSVRVASVVNAIRSVLADSLVSGHQERLKQPELRQRVLNAYFDECEANARLYLKEPLVPVALTHWKEEAVILRQRYGDVEAWRETAQPTLEGALDMAWRNLRLAQQRWMAWLALGSMFWHTPEGLYRPGNGQGVRAEVHDFNAVSDALRRELQAMEKRLLMFGLLSEGEAASAVRRWAHRTHLGEGMSVMEYLRVDGQLPSSWSCEEENQFRASLSQAAQGAQTASMRVER